MKCGKLSDRNRCPDHRGEDRPSSTARGYDNAWRKVRSEFLRLNPFCLDCGQPATVPDHSPLTRAELLANGIGNPDAPAFLQPRCKSCHDRKTALEDGGFGRPRLRESQN